MPMTPEAQALAEFILWARKNRVQVAHIKLGEIEVSFTDLALYERDQAAKAGTDKSPAERPTIYQEMAGDLFSATPTAPSSATVDPTEEDDD